MSDWILSLCRCLPSVFFCGIGALSTFAQEGPKADPVPFETRLGFEPRPLSDPPIPARRAGLAEADVYALAVHAVGDVHGLRLADIGAGRGRHLLGLSQRVGAEGRLFATEIDREDCDALRAAAKTEGLTNVEVLLATKTNVGLEPGSIDLALLSDVYQFVILLDGRGGQDKHAFLTSLQKVIAPGGQVVVTYVTSSELRELDTRRALLENTLRDFAAYGFEPGRRWIVEGPHWPHLVLEFRSPKDGPIAPRVYMGRTIAKTMHWTGGQWLLRDERAREEATAKMLGALGVKPGQSVADFGCGNGYHTLQLARLVGPEGHVYGIDIQPEMLSQLEERAAQQGLEIVEPVLGTLLDAPLPPASCDLVLLADVYHELSHPVPMLASIRRALKPGGRVAVLEFRAEDPDVPIKPLHKMKRDQIVAEFEANGLKQVGGFEELPWQHLCFFEAERSPR